MATLSRIGQEDGWFRAAGNRHWALFSEDGPALVVTFDTLAAARARPDGRPALFELSETMGWSYLCILADGETWFRDPAVYALFDGLVDDGFFDAFDRVLFYGAGMAGHAACAFSVTAPGARVLAVTPRASMAPLRVPFETRNREARRLDFASRYGFAPDMLRAAEHVDLIYDPLCRPDAAQAALFQDRNITHHYLRLMSDRAEDTLSELDLLPKLIEAALKGTLTPLVFARLWRARRQHVPYLRRLVDRAELGGSLVRQHAICANVGQRTRNIRFRRRAEELEAMMAASAVEV